MRAPTQPYTGSRCSRQLALVVKRRQRTRGTSLPCHARCSCPHGTHRCARLQARPASHASTRAWSRGPRKHRRKDSWTCPRPCSGSMPDFYQPAKRDDYVRHYRFPRLGPNSELVPLPVLDHWSPILGLQGDFPHTELIALCGILFAVPVVEFAKLPQLAGILELTIDKLCAPGAHSR